MRADRWLVVLTWSLVSAFSLATASAQGGLEIDKRDPEDPIVQGDSLTYEVWITNNWDTTLVTLPLTDTLPPGTTFVSASIPPDSSTGGTLEWTNLLSTVGPLAVGQQMVILVEIRVDGATSPIVNSVTSHDVYDSLGRQAGDGSDAESTTVLPLQTIPLDLSDSPDPVAVGDVLTYTIAVTNPGPNDLTSMTVQHTLPAGTMFQSAVDPNWSCSHTAGVVTCTYTGTPLAPMQSESIAVVAQVTTASGPLLSSVSGTAEDEAGNSREVTGDSETTAVATPGAVAITLADSPDPVVVGAVLTYTITVTNPGPTDLSTMTIDHTLPAGTTFLSAADSSWSCAHVTPTVTCTYTGAPWAAGQAESLDVVVQVDTVDGPLTSSVSGSAQDEFGNPLMVTGDTESTGVVGPTAIPTLSDMSRLLVAAALLALGMHFARRG